MKKLDLRIYLSVLFALLSEVIYLLIRNYSINFYEYWFIESISNNFINLKTSIINDDFNYVLILFFIVLYFIYYLFFSFFYFRREIKRFKLIQKYLKKYINPAIFTDLVNRPKEIKLGGEIKDISVYFIDIWGFRQMCLDYSREVIIEYINDCFSEIGDLILKMNWTIDKYEGDAVLAFWWAPHTVNNHEFLACKAALLHQKMATKLNKKWKKKNKPFVSFDAWIVSGRAIVGNIGNKKFLSYTIIWRRVNTCFELEHLNRKYWTKILVSEQTFLRTKDHFVFREIDEVKLKSRKGAIRIFELIDDKWNASSKVLELIDLYEKALYSYKMGNYEDAKKLINNCLRIAPEDIASWVLSEKISKLNKVKKSSKISLKEVN